MNPITGPYMNVENEYRRDTIRNEMGALRSSRRGHRRPRALFPPFK